MTRIETVDTLPVTAVPDPGSRARVHAGVATAAGSARDAAPLLDVQGLQTTFFTDAGPLRAVDGVSLQVHRGEVLGLVGESGSGKTVTGFSILGLLEPPGKITGGRILFGGQDLAGLDAESARSLRGKRIAMIFQDPMMTLNPVLKISTQMVEAITAHEAVSRSVARERARDALAMVGIPHPDERLDAYPHQFSGGMRQRVAIAIALLHRPDLIIADEPTTALDVTIQAQIVAQIKRLAAMHRIGMIWITHDLSIVSRLADDLAVMYAGRIVEYGPTKMILRDPRHPYTHGLVGSIPSANRPGTRLHQIPGMTPSLSALPSGCAFRTRCTRADDRCVTLPPLTDIGGRHYRCFHPVAGREDKWI